MGPDVADGQRSLELHAVRVVGVPPKVDHLSRDRHDVTVVHAPRVSVDSGPDLALPATRLGLPALGVGLAFARAHGAKGDALAGPAVFDQVVVLRLVRREEVGARLEPLVVKTPDRRVAASVEPDALSIPTESAEGVILLAIAREKVVAAPPVVEAPDRTRARAGSCPGDTLSGPAAPTEAVVLGPVRGVEVLSRPPVVEAQDLLGGLDVEAGGGDTDMVAQTRDGDGSCTKLNIVPVRDLVVDPLPELLASE